MAINTSSLSAAALALCVGVLGSGALAGQNANVLILTGVIASDRLIIRQSDEAAHSANIMIETPEAVDTGDVWQRATSTVLRAGLIAQDGTGHDLSLLIGGRDNQVAIHQTGVGHSAQLGVSGRNNIASVQQQGLASRAAVTQSGLRNTVVISQK